MDLHPACAPLSFLLGTWKGAGSGHYPTIESFDYLEEVTFTHAGKPFLAYTQRTRHPSTGEPMHAETGYLRAVGGVDIEFVVAQPSGIAELHHGTATDRRLHLTSSVVHTTPAAKSVDEVVRAVWVSQKEADEVLSYDVSMAAVGQPLTHHLHAELVRQDDR